MRVIAGSRRSIPLATLPTKKVRPTTDRIKETLFNMLGDSLRGIRFLDMFAGSGQIGIEALSRGAAYATFVESDRQAVSCIRGNLEKTRFVDSSRIIPSDCRAAIPRLAEEEPFEVIFMDPPYQMEGVEELLASIANEHILSEDGILILEADVKTQLSPAGIAPLACFREKIYKTNKHLFFEVQRS
ncbi:MAG: 16S rRNA (guanine(966)-N(2))-methyltransferase RsmD [Lachnospiraceae bacterium]|nr:16S rRNA (guanine(966)-N(2))-methyltransferase RsmD [Lachnospiraceae bacterium]